MAAEYRCLNSIETQQTLSAKLINQLNADWEAMPDAINAHQSLENIQVYDGHPREGAALVPDNEDSREEPFWTFPKDQKRRIWIACIYSQSIVRLVKQLPEAVKKCTLKYRGKSKQIDRILCE